MKRIIVDANDTIVGAKESRDIDYSNEIYRVAALWLWNSDDEILIAQRKAAKGNDAGQWGPTVAGTVEEGESYEANITKETQEEIGVVGIEFELDEKLLILGLRNYFVQFFRARLDKPAEDFELQSEEVESVRWIKPAQLKQEVSAHPEKFVPAMKRSLELL